MTLWPSLSLCTHLKCIVMITLNFPRFLKGFKSIRSVIILYSYRWNVLREIFAYSSFVFLVQWPGSSQSSLKMQNSKRPVFGRSDSALYIKMFLDQCASQPTLVKWNEKEIKFKSHRSWENKTQSTVKFLTSWQRRVALGFGTK